MLYDNYYTDISKDLYKDSLNNKIGSLKNKIICSYRVTQTQLRHLNKVWKLKYNRTEHCYVVFIYYIYIYTDIPIYVSENNLKRVDISKRQCKMYVV